MNGAFHLAAYQRVQRLVGPEGEAARIGPIKWGYLHHFDLLALAFFAFANRRFHVLAVHHEVGEAALFVLRNHHRAGVARERRRSRFAAIHDNAARTTRAGAVIIRALPVAGCGTLHHNFAALLDRRSRHHGCFGSNGGSRGGGRRGSYAGGPLVGVGRAGGFGRRRRAGLPAKSNGFDGLAATGQRAGQGHAAAQQAQPAQHQRPGQQAFGQRGGGGAALHQAAHPQQQGPGPVQGGQGEARRGGYSRALAPLGQGGEGAGQPERVAAHEGRGGVVAAIFALGAHAGGHKPHGRMVEKQHLGHGLEQVHEVVAAQHVGQLVRQNGFQVRRRQARHRAQRQQNHGAHVAHHQRHPHQRRFQQLHRPAHAAAGRQRGQPLLPPGAQRAHPVAPQPLHVQQAAQHAQAHGQQAQQPRQHQQRQVVIQGVNE